MDQRELFGYLSEREDVTISELQGKFSIGYLEAVKTIHRLVEAGVLCESYGPEYLVTEEGKARIAEVLSSEPSSAPAPAAPEEPEEVDEFDELDPSEEPTEEPSEDSSEQPEREPEEVFVVDDDPFEEEVIVEDKPVSPVEEDEEEPIEEEPIEEVLEVEPKEELPEEEPVEEVLEDALDAQPEEVAEDAVSEDVEEDVVEEGPVEIAETFEEEPESDVPLAEDVEDVEDVEETVSFEPVEEPEPVVIEEPVVEPFEEEEPVVEDVEEPAPEVVGEPVKEEPVLVEVPVQKEPVAEIPQEELPEMEPALCLEKRGEYYLVPNVGRARLVREGEGGYFTDDGETYRAVLSGKADGKLFELMKAVGARFEHGELRCRFCTPQSMTKAAMGVVFLRFLAHAEPAFIPPVHDMEKDEQAKILCDILHDFAPVYGGRQEGPAAVRDRFFSPLPFAAERAALLRTTMGEALGVPVKVTGREGEIDIERNKAEVDLSAETILENVPAKEGRYLVGEGWEHSPLVGDLSESGNLLIEGGSAEEREELLTTVLYSLLYFTPSVRIRLPKSFDTPLAPRLNFYREEDTLRAISEAVEESERRERLLTEEGNDFVGHNKGAVRPLRRTVLVLDGTKTNELLRGMKLSKRTGVHFVVLSSRPLGLARGSVSFPACRVLLSDGSAEAEGLRPFECLFEQSEGWTRGVYAKTSEKSLYALSRLPAELSEEELYRDALAAVIQKGTASPSVIAFGCNTTFKFAVAALSWMEEKGFVSRATSPVATRDVLLSKEDFEAQFGPIG